MGDFLLGADEEDRGNSGKVKDAKEKLYCREKMEFIQLPNVE